VLIYVDIATLQLQRILTKTCSWTKRRLTDWTPTWVWTCTPMALQTLPNDDLDARDFRRRTSTPLLPSTIIHHRRPANDNATSPPPCCSMITRHIAHDGVLAISTRLLHRPIVIRHEALVGLPPRGKRSFRSSTLLWYQLLGFAYGSITWSYSKTRRDKIYRQVCVSQALNCFSLFVIFLGVTTHWNKVTSCIYIHAGPRPELDGVEVYIHCIVSSIRSVFWTH
jgi:hypothetical protein